MKAKIEFEGKDYFLDLNENDKYSDLKIKFIKNIPHKSHSLIFKYIFIDLKCNVKLMDYYHYSKNEIFPVKVYYMPSGGGYIDNLKEESKSPLAKRIGFDMNLLKRNELNVNLIHFDYNMTNEENYKYFNNFKIDVIGGFYAMDDVNILKKFLKKIFNRNNPLIVVSSGSSGREIIPICKQESNIKEVIIFCMDYENNKHYIDEYPGYVKKVYTSIDELYDYLKKFYGQIVCPICQPEAPYQFKEYEIQMNGQIQECPLITADEYDKCYFLVHKAISYFFDNFDSNNHSFNKQNFLIIKYFLIRKFNDIKYYKDEDISRLVDIFKELHNAARYDIFVEETIRKYTGESIFSYLLNKMMRNIESGIIYLSYFMGPYIFELNKYVRNRKECAFSKDMILFRKIKCTETEFYLYKLNLHHIICFPAFTSTSSEDTDYEPTKLAGEINKKDDDDCLKLKLIIKYTHENGNISPGIIVENKKGYNNKYISCCPNENEVLLFPFTFAKIINIGSEIKENEEIKIVTMELINRKSYLEYILKNNYEQRPKFSDI